MPRFLRLCFFHCSWGSESSAESSGDRRGTGHPWFSGHCFIHHQGHQGSSGIPPQHLGKWLSLLVGSAWRQQPKMIQTARVQVSSITLHALLFLYVAKVSWLTTHSFVESSCWTQSVKSIQTCSNRSQSWRICRAKGTFLWELLLMAVPFSFSPC